ncbi:MAG: hypothetical protein IT317_21025 [Anaerolineales bacterium]|nr:hypothetical protein [Anaerolineales bacterium]
MLITIISIAGSCLLGLVITGGVLFVVWRVMKGLGPNRQILQNGIAAQATIRQVWQTGTYVNYNPQIGMQLEVQPPNGAAYMAQVNAVVPMVNIPQFQPGVVVPVKIHPTDPSKVELNVYGG